jgi:hypothetical protein
LFICGLRAGRRCGRGPGPAKKDVDAHSADAIAAQSLIYVKGETTGAWQDSTP